MGEQTYATQNYAYAAALDDFDGAAAADACYFPSGVKIAGIKVDLYAQSATAGIISVPFYLQYLSGSTWNGTQWVPGTWTSWFVGIVTYGCVAASNIIFAQPYHEDFEPAMYQPAASRQTILAPAGHSKAGQTIVPNTGSATETAGRYDARLIFDAPDVGTAANWIAYANVQCITQG